MENALISIIVPLYQAEAHVATCVQTVLCQTYPHWELLLINDGSTDATGAVCDQYAAADERIRVVHQENGGVSAARNRGLDCARGEYIVFLDADDLLKPDFLETLYGDALEQGADIVCCNVEECIDGRCRDYYAVRESRRYQGSEHFLRDYIENKNLYGYTVWAKLMKAERVKQYRFKPIGYSEDTRFIVEVMLGDPVVYLDSYTGYTYIRWETSVTKKYGPKYIPHRIEQLLTSSYIFECTKSLDADVFAMSCNRFARDIHNGAAATAVGGTGTFSRHRELLLGYVEMVRPYWSQLDRKNRQRLWLYLYAPAVYYLRIRAIPLVRVIRKIPFLRGRGE